MLDKLKALPRRWKWLGTILEVQKRFGEVRGGEMASAITLAAFLSLFPLLLVAIAVTGFISVGHVDLAQTVIDKLSLRGEAAKLVTDALHKAEQSRKAASIIGLVGLLWSGLGLVSVIQGAFNSVWQVQGRGLKDKAIGLAWLVGAGLIFTASFALTAGLQTLPGWVAPLGIVVATAMNVALFLWSSKVLPNRDVPLKALLPGAIFGGVGFEVLTIVGSYYVPRLVSSSSALYGSIGVVFAIIAWLFFFSRVIVYSAVINVVLWEHAHGTVTIEVEAPRLDGHVPLEANRSGQVTVEA